MLKYQLLFDNQPIGWITYDEEPTFNDEIYYNEYRLIIYDMEDDTLYVSLVGIGDYANELDADDGFTPPDSFLNPPEPVNPLDEIPKDDIFKYLFNDEQIFEMERLARNETNLYHRYPRRANEAVAQINAKFKKYKLRIERDRFQKALDRYNQQRPR